MVLVYNGCPKHCTPTPCGIWTMFEQMLNIDWIWTEKEQSMHLVCCTSQPSSKINKVWIWTKWELSLIIRTNIEWGIFITLGRYLYWTLLEQRLMSCPVSRQNLTWMRTKLAPFLKDWTGYAQTLNNIWMGTELEQTPNIPGTEFEFPFRLCSGPTSATSTEL